jgi:hypothetical protein
MLCAGACRAEKAAVMTITQQIEQNPAVLQSNLAVLMLLQVVHDELLPMRSCCWQIMHKYSHMLWLLVLGQACCHHVVTC